MIYIFEGLDGSGKTTQIEKFKNYCSKLENISTVKTFREPGGTLAGEYIRDILKSNLKLTAKQYLTLFCTSRYFLNKQLEEFKHDDTCIAILDRFILSTYAYQQASGLNEYIITKYISDICGCGPFAIQEYQSKTFFIDVDPKICFNRIDKRNEEKDSFERLDFLTKVYDNYHSIIDNNKYLFKNVEIINGNQEPDKVFSDILEKI